MQSSISQVAASALLFFSAVQGHMVMNTPHPYDWPASPPNNSPLGPGDFPCKAATQYIVNDQNQNVMAIGETQKLSFTGSAVHGGGSCQVSLTTDTKPTKNSKWMVIKSIEGGCPASVAGNLPADPNGSGASTFEYTIPEGIAPGQYTIAWTWNNKIGNREFYMNCGPATVTAAKKKRYVPQGVSLVRKQSSFPDMFVANLADVNDCTTPESFDYNYPNPGDAVQSAGTGPYTQLACGAAGGNAPAASPTAQSSAPVASAGSASATVLTQSSPAMVSSGAAAPTGGAPAQTQSLGGVFASGAASAPAATASAPAASAPAASAPVASVPAASVPAPSASAAPAPASSGTSSSGQQTPGTACSPEGTWLCLGTSYQRCASSEWSAIMQLATGMTCTPGMSSSISMTPGKRSAGGWVRNESSFKA